MIEENERADGGGGSLLGLNGHLDRAKAGVLGLGGSFVADREIEINGVGESRGEVVERYGRRGDVVEGVDRCLFLGGVAREVDGAEAQINVTVPAVGARIGREHGRENGKLARAGRERGPGVGALRGAPGKSVGGKIGVADDSHDGIDARQKLRRGGVGQGDGGGGVVDDVVLRARGRTRTAIERGPGADTVQTFGEACGNINMRNALRSGRGKSNILIQGTWLSGAKFVAE